MRQIHGHKGKKENQTYLWVTERNRCWETRELKNGMNDERRIAAGVYEHSVRDFTKFLNEEGWGVLAKKLSQ